MAHSVALADRPSHVPPELVVDFDFYHPEGAEDDVHAAWLRLRQFPPIFWTPRNGGHWIATRSEDIKEIQTNHELFSYVGVTIPRSSTPLLPIETDPPRHTELRAIISPLFQPDTLRTAKARAGELARSLIDGFYSRGHCEFMSEFARHVPVCVFLSLVDLPLEDRPKLLELAEIRVRSPDSRARDAAKAAIVEYLQEFIVERRIRPRGDFISRILQSRIGGRALSEDEANNILATVMSGGLDTVASMTGFVMRFLAISPGHRRQLIENPALIPSAVDELIRRHGLSNTARTVRRDMNFRGVELRKGEQIQIPNCLVGLDEKLFEKPLEVDFSRPNASAHAAFGNGPHRCPGANLGRIEIRVMVEEWLKKIPDFWLDSGRRVRMSSGLVNTIVQLPLVWTP